ncbi:ABC transporter permease [Amycolatopsis jejuensis]|uniref:ABC transporter permease n=1 Tax=Amycolatopsis jejuensis TaxID=330084 RepID=UPI000527EAC0|nr:FtsX-like permease family protein [Amycolatopsis jejuensis]
MLSLAWQTIRTRLGGFIGAFIAILFGTALVAGCGILMDSGLRAGVPTQRYADAAVVVGGVQTIKPPSGDALTFEKLSEQATLPADLVGKLAGLPGVRAAVGEQNFPAYVVGRDGQLLADVPSLGHNWDAAALAPFTLRSGKAPAGPDEVVLDAGLAKRAGVDVGRQIQVETHGKPIGFTVSGIAAPSDGDSLSRQSALFFSAEKAAELSGRPGQVHAIGVLAAPGVSADTLAEQVRTAVGQQQAEVTTGVERSTVEFADVSQTRTILLAVAGSFGGYVLLVAVFVVASTLTLLINQRRREFALLRAIAATPKQVRRLIGLETTIVAGAAGVLGALLGIPVALGLRSAFAGIGVVPSDFSLVIGPIPLAAALVLGLATAWLAAWSASRRPASINPVEALSEAAVEKPKLGMSRLVTGWSLVLIGLGAALVPLGLRGEIATAAATSATLVVVIGLAVVGPQVVTFMTKLVAPVLSRVSRSSGYLAAANSRANSRRLAAAVTPLMLAVAFAISFYYSQTSSTAAANDQAAGATTADYVLKSSTGGLSPEVAEAVRHTPGVASATSVVTTSVLTFQTVLEDQEVTKSGAQGVNGDQLQGNLDLGVDTGRIADLTGNTVALSRAQADSMGKKVGDEIDLILGDGSPAKLRVVATYTRDMAFGSFVLPADLARQHTTSQLDGSVLVKLAPGADANAVATALQGISAQYPGTAVSQTKASAPERTEQQAQFYLNLIAIGVILGYVAISVANTLVMSTVQRNREFALLQLIGSTRRQVVRMMRLEALATVGVAVVVGTLIPLIPLAVLNIGLTGLPLPSGPIAVYFGIIGGAILLGMLAMGLATRTALRARPIDSIGLRE